MAIKQREDTLTDVLPEPALMLIYLLKTSAFSLFNVLLFYQLVPEGFRYVVPWSQ